MGVFGVLWLWVDAVSGEKMGRMRTTTKVVVHKHDAPPALPRVPPSHSSLELKRTGPHPSEKGRGTGGQVSALRGGKEW
jgi:hypothetical protein